MEALTWHHYYLNGHIATLDDFLNPIHLDELPQSFQKIDDYLAKNSMKKPMWLGETSSAYGGGAHGKFETNNTRILWDSFDVDIFRSI